jgi:hypothetical protein
MFRGSSGAAVPAATRQLELFVSGSSKLMFPLKGPAFKLLSYLTPLIVSLYRKTVETIFW